MPKPNQKHESFEVTVDYVENYAIFTLDIDGRITSWNKGAENIKGWKKDEVLGKYFDFLYPEDQIASKKPQKNLELTKKHGVHEEQGWRIKKDGTLFLADITISLIHDKKTKKPVGFIKVVRDITKQRKQENDQIDANTLLKKEIERRQIVEEALQLSNEELDAFASAASHDLQEPLRMVVSYLQLIERRYNDVFDADGKEFLGYAIDGAYRMKMLISDLVEYSRIDTLGKPLSQTDMNETLHLAIDNVDVAIKESKAQVTYDTLPTVIGDQIQLTQLFQNLLINAIKFKGANPPKIHIGVREESDHYVFSIKDTGKGIAEKDLDKIFVIFKQLGKRSERKGSGLGLAMAKKIVSRHQGKIWATSKINTGSTFYFTIPKQIRKEEEYE